MAYSIKLVPVIVGPIVGQVAHLPVALLVIRPLGEQHFSVGHWWLIPQRQWLDSTCNGSGMHGLALNDWDQCSGDATGASHW